MKFNTLLKNNTRKPNTLNLAGGQAHEMSDRLELVTIMLTGFLENQFYRNGNDTAKRLTQLIAKIPDKRFVARAALYARREAGMRSVSHLVAGEIAHDVKGADWTKRFFDRVVFRGLAGLSWRRGVFLPLGLASVKRLAVYQADRLDEDRLAAELGRLRAAVRRLVA